MAVPGSVRAPSCAGTNRLLAEGCAPARDATDVLVALGLSTATRAATRDARPTPDPSAATVLEAFGWEPATLEHLAVRTGLALPHLAVALQSLLATGWIEAEGGWYERVSA
jgi:DNA processing protein